MINQSHSDGIGVVQRIQSRSNPKLKSLLSRKEELFFFEGEKLVHDLLERGHEIAVLVVHEKEEKAFKLPVRAVVRETWFVSGDVLSKISSLKETPDHIAVLEWKEERIDFRTSRVVIALDGVQDPGNAGVVFRCAAAFGLDSIVMTGESVKLNNSKFLRAAQNAFFEIKCQHIESVEALIEKAQESNPYVHIYLTSSHFPENAILPQDVRFPALIIFGNEGQGIREDYFDRFPSIRIPQTGIVESLNLGVSAGIIMSHLFKQ